MCIVMLPKMVGTCEFFSAFIKWTGIISGCNLAIEWMSNDVILRKINELKKYIPWCQNTIRNFLCRHSQMNDDCKHD